MLYYGWAVDPCILPAINEITKSIVDTERKCIQLMDYTRTCPSASIRYHASNMLLHLDSDTAYLVQHNARSRGYDSFYISNTPASKSTKPVHTPNGAILNKCSTLKNVMLSAVEAEVGPIFNDPRAAVPIRFFLQ